jgi:hypothetical protein
MVANQSHHAPRADSKSRQITFNEPMSWMRLLMTTALFSIATSAVVVGLESRHAATTAAAAAQITAGYESPLGLKVTSRKQQLEIRWDHELRAVLNAGKGLIKITEGEMTELIPLDRGDLRDGYVSYTALTNDVRIRFEVNQADGTSVTESARVVAIP